MIKQNAECVYSLAHTQPPHQFTANVYNVGKRYLRLFNTKMSIDSNGMLWIFDTQRIIYQKFKDLMR